MHPLTQLGVAICTYNSADVIIDCLETLLRSKGVALNVVIADNASTDGTPDLIRQWSKSRNWSIPSDCPFTLDLTHSSGSVDLRSGRISGAQHRLRFVETGVNGGFAYGINNALGLLLEDPGIERFWILNPDCLVPETTALAFTQQGTAGSGFSLMGGRVLYCDEPMLIQIDGGTLNRWTGVTGNINLGRPHQGTPPPAPSDMTFITGASLVASRAFIERSGLMPEDYFLYYEEVDWALRRGDLPLAYCPEAIVFHRAGTAIGSPTLGRSGSVFSTYFKHRARLRFVRRHYPASLPIAIAYSVAKALQQLLKGGFRSALSIILGSLGLPPTKDVRVLLSPTTRRRLFRKTNGAH